MSERKELTHNEDTRIPVGISVPTLKSGRVSYRSWYLPTTYDQLTIQEGLDYLAIVAAPQGQIPEIIRWTEGKDSHLVKNFFYGGVELGAHDCIHLLLGRGLLTKDEAFIIGFTMGSTNKLETLNKDIFAYIAAHYYPNAYQMDEEARRVFMDAAKLGHIYQCKPLDAIKFEPFLNTTIRDVRSQHQLPLGLIESYYRDIEKVRFPDDKASQRLATDHLSWARFYFEGEDIQMTLKGRAHISEKALNESDQHFECRFDDLEQIKNHFVSTHSKYLMEQRDVSQECFEEIRRICGDDHPEVAQDLKAKPWDKYFQTSLDNLNKVSESVLNSQTRNAWEEPGPGLENRSYVHALLNRGDSPVDRAFCRGFFDGSADDKSTYAADLKLDVLSEHGVSLDGPYTEDMRRAYHNGVYLAYISDTVPLMDVSWSDLETLTINCAREKLNLATSILESYTTEIETSFYIGGF